MVLHQPTNYDFSHEWVSVFMMFTVQTMLFIYIAAATFIALDAAVTSFSPKDKYFYSFIFSF